MKDDLDIEQSTLLPSSNHASSRRQNRPYLALALSTLLLASLATNIHLLLARPQTPLSPYASLPRSRSVPYIQHSIFTSPNETRRREAWHNISIDAGMVALADSWTAAHGLPSAERFPWDPTKGIYLLHGFHNLHCLKVIHRSLDEWRTGAPQTRNAEHVDHCLDALRRQVLCDADDTPRAVERRREVVTGVGQHRQCRDWAQLEQWASAHTACYQRPEFPEDGTPILERFKHCPDQSAYVVDPDWVPVDPVVEGLPDESLWMGM